MARLQKNQDGLKKTNGLNNQGGVRGFSLNEVLVTLALTSIVLGIFASNLPQLQRVSNQFLEQTAFEENYLLFLILFERDYYAAESSHEQEKNLKNLIFQQDQNLNGNYLDQGEQVFYRWNSKEKRIDRKTTAKGYFQALLEGVEKFSWEKVKTSPLCYQLRLKSKFSSKAREILYCKPLP